LAQANVTFPSITISKSLQVIVKATSKNYSAPANSPKRFVLGEFFAIIPATWNLFGV
jgi:hypothetical protein